MSLFNHHKYTWTKPFESVRHQWELVGPEGGIHFHVSILKGHDPSCGLEFHHCRAAWDRITGRKEAPHHIDCFLIHEPCWHDGTSLYSYETVWPSIKPWLQVGNHEAIFMFLEHEYKQRFEIQSE